MSYRPELRFARLVPALRALLRVRPALVAALLRLVALRRRALVWACRDNAEREAACDPSRISAPLVALDLFADGARFGLLWPLT